MRAKRFPVAQQIVTLVVVVSQELFCVLRRPLQCIDAVLLSIIPHLGIVHVFAFMRVVAVVVLPGRPLVITRMIVARADSIVTPFASQGGHARFNATCRDTSPIAGTFACTAQASALAAGLRP